jgi:hypothetical protein
MEQIHTEFLTSAKFSVMSHGAMDESVLAQSRAFLAECESLSAFFSLLSSSPLLDTHS